MKHNNLAFVLNEPVNIDLKFKYSGFSDIVLYMTNKTLPLIDHKQHGTKRYLLLITNNMEQNVTSY